MNSLSQLVKSHFQIENQEQDFFQEIEVETSNWNPFLFCIHKDKYLLFK